MQQNETLKRLRPRQRKAIEALLTSGDLQEVADAVGVSRATLWRWRQQPAFQDAITAAEGDALAQLSRDLLRLSGKAIVAVEDALDKSYKPYYRLRAVEITLGQLTKLRELTSLETRLAALEKQIGRTQ